MSEQETLWIQQAIKGDDEAFGRLVENYQTPVYHLCYRMLGNSNDAEDAAQESFIRAYRYLKKYDPNRSFATWIIFHITALTGCAKENSQRFLLPSSRQRSSLTEMHPIQKNSSNPRKKKH